MMVYIAIIILVYVYAKVMAIVFFRGM